MKELIEGEIVVYRTLSRAAVEKVLAELRASRAHVTMRSEWIAAAPPAPVCALKLYRLTAPPEFEAEVVRCLSSRGTPAGRED